MKILSFSAVEILPALLNKTKRQTIRPAWYKIEKLPLMNGGKIEKVLPFPIPKWEGEIKKQVVKNFKKRIEKTQNKIRSILASGGLKPARFKIGEKVSICWKLRGTPKDAMFCGFCGGLLKMMSAIISGYSESEGSYSHNKALTCEEHGSFSPEIIAASLKPLVFPKLLGTATITETFQIEMGKNDEGRLALRNSKYGSEGLALSDGFKNREEMFAYFDSRYNLSSPKTFWVYRWRWE